MKYYGINTSGQVIIGRLDSLPDWSTADIGRLVKVGDNLYLGGDSNWIGISTLPSSRGVFGGGYTSAADNTIDYIDISITSNATDFGDLTVARHGISATSNGTSNRGVFGGGFDGNNNSNTVDYIDISASGNASDFGDLTVARRLPSSISNGLQ